MLCSSKVDVGKPVGIHPCTYGPSYWCQNEQNAEECHARSHCETKVWLGPKPNNTNLLGVDHCSRGPGYWCQTEETANECGLGARSHCQIKVWFGSKPHNEKLVGADHCTRGPGYWCQNEETANECGVEAMEFCKKHWNLHRVRKSVTEDGNPQFIMGIRPGTSLGMHNPVKSPGKKKI